MRRCSHTDLSSTALELIQLVARKSKKGKSKGKKST